jgi:hypothetical protein
MLIVIPTKSIERLCRSIGAWRDLLFSRIARNGRKSRFLDCEDHPLRGQSSSLGMTECKDFASFPVVPYCRLFCHDRVESVVLPYEDFSEELVLPELDCLQPHQFQ